MTTTIRHRATAIALTEQGVLVIREKRKEVFSLPGGGIEEGEFPQAAVRRELKEETGLESQLLGFLFFQKGEEFLSFRKKRKMQVLHHVYLIKVTENWFNELCLDVGEISGIGTYYENRVLLASGSAHHNLLIDKPTERILERFYALQACNGSQWQQHGQI